jgi:enoyl-CoA hydratase/carnithine racemase
MITGRPLSPEEAHALGIFDRIFPMHELTAQTTAYAQQIAKGASFAVGSIKRAVNGGMQLPLREALAHERAITSELFQTEDAREGIQAFIEKRKPVYKGR